jgi:hypothetical protein
VRLDTGRSSEFTGAKNTEAKSGPYKKQRKISLELSHNFAMAHTVRDRRRYQMLGWTLFGLSIAALFFHFIFLHGGPGTAGTPEMLDYQLQQRQH